MRKNTDEKPRQRTNPPDTVIREAGWKDAELLVELGKRAFIEDGILKLSAGNNLWSEAMSRKTLSLGGIFKD